MTDSRRIDLHDALGVIRRHLPQVADLLKLDSAADLSTWAGVIDRKLLPRTSPDFPLIATICGGGSSGKSTLFNTLTGEAVSPTGGRAGMNRRVLISARTPQIDRNGHLKAVFEPFNTSPESLVDKAALLTPGAPLYVSSNSIPEHLILVDTPDFDTGARGVYANRAAAAAALETADILIYIFTNSNYNNRDNTDFIADMLTGIGRRKCFLVYRVYPSFETDEVLDHAKTVARNLYGKNADTSVLGVYRVDDDNEVAAGRQPMTIRPVDPQDPPFMAALARLDHRRIRLELMASILSDVLNDARRAADRAALSRDRLQLYMETLQTARSHCVQEALQHFPVDRVMGRFAQIWLSTDPAHIRAMRKTGKILDLPVRTLVKTVRWARQKLSETPSRLPQPDVSDSMADDLLQAANRLHRHTLEETLCLTLPPADPLARRITEAMEAPGSSGETHGSSGETNRSSGETPGPAGGTNGPSGKHHNPSAPRLEPTGDSGQVRVSVPAHPAAAPAQAAIRTANWKQVLEGILSQRELLTSVSKDIDRELTDLVLVFRAKMGFWEQTRQTFSAFLNVLPATVAVTYILSTGDPVGAAGIKVKLTGLFGLHDLYALVALPATTGLKQADLNQLEGLIGPIAKAWLKNKLQVVETLFDTRITGELVAHLRQTIETADRQLTAIRDGIDACERALTPI